MPGSHSAHIQELNDALDSIQVDQRVAAIEALGEIGDEESLYRLRERLKVVGKEMAALIAAVGKLKRRLGVK